MRATTNRIRALVRAALAGTPIRTGGSGPQANSGWTARGRTRGDPRIVADLGQAEAEAAGLRNGKTAAQSFVGCGENFLRIEAKVCACLVKDLGRPGETI
jgi:hypothetical protein